MDDRYSLVDVAIDGETRTAVSGVLTRERGRRRAHGWLDRFSPDDVPSEYDLRALTSSGHLLTCRIVCVSASSSPARTEFEVVGELDISKLS